MTMPNEQPNTPSTDVQASDATTAATGSDERAAESSEKAPSWWDRVLRRAPVQETTSDSGDQPKPNSSASSTLSVTQEELDRRVQAETDRREAKRAQDAKVQQRRQLRDSDPWAYAEQDRKDEQVTESTGQIQNFLASVGTEHDRVSIDPVIELLPKEERERILKLDNAGKGLDGRKLVVTESLKALEKHWKAEGAKDAEAKLRRNPAFRKQVLAEIRGGTTVEPELLPSVGAPAAESSVSALLRARYGIGSGNAMRS